MKMDQIASHLDQEYSKTVYLKIGKDCFVLLLNNSKSYAKVSQLRLEPELQKVYFQYQAIDYETRQVTEDKLVKKNLSDKVWDLITSVGERNVSLVYGHLQVFALVNGKSALTLISNSSSPGYLDQIRVIPDESAVEFIYHDLKRLDGQGRSTGKLVRKELGVPIRRIDQIWYGSLPSVNASCSISRDLILSWLEFLDQFVVAEIPDSYFLFGQTMLSAIRSQGIIKTDRELAIGVLGQADVLKLRKRLTLERSKYLLVDQVGIVLKDRELKGTVKVFDCQLGCQLGDIFHFKLAQKTEGYWAEKFPQDKLYLINSGDKSTIWWKIGRGVLNIPQSFVFPLKQEFLHGKHYNLINQAKEYAKAVYGETALTHYPVEYSSRFSFSQGGNRERKELTDYSPVDGIRK